MMKRWLALLLAMLLVFSLGTTAFAAEEVEEEPVVPAGLVRTVGLSAARAIMAGVDPADIVYYDHVTIGNTAHLKGDFFTDLWGNVTSDMDVRNFLHGYNLIRWDGDNGMFTTDPTVVTGVVVTENAAGDRTYTFALNNDLRYSDGTPITAWDYAFSFLLTMSDEIQGAGAVPRRQNFIVGSENYHSGAQDLLSGVRVTADDMIAITLSNEYLPFFYEMGLLSCNPYPISVIAPGVSVFDDGEGVYLENSAGGGGAPVFTAELLNRTLNDPATGYRTHPSVVSGPYMLDSFDGTTAEFTRNPIYLGNANDQMPLVQHITYTLAENTNMVEKLQNGEFDILNKVTDANSIAGGTALIADGSVGMSNYPRSGLSYVVFTCENPTVSSPAVRQAIAWCMDRDAVVADYTGNYGIRVDGYYGVGQWMYGLINGTVAPPVVPPENEFDVEAQEAYEKELEAWEELSLDNLTDYELDLDRARALLNQDGWTLNADGLREKMVNGVQTVLDLTMLYPEGNRVVESLEKNFAANLAEVGIRLTMKSVPLSEITAKAYQSEARDVDMIYMASNFDLLYDPAQYFGVGEDMGRSFSKLSDRELYNRALAMRETEPGEVLEYMQNWVLFQERLNEQLPILPVYSNVYFDFYTGLMHDYNVSQNSTCAEAMIGANKADIPEIEVEEEPAEEAEAGDGEIIIDG